MQKIADNARRIRQSPRYYHNAAVAAREGEDYTVGYAGAEWVPGSQQERQPFEGERDVASDERAICAPELPTSVESGYEQLQAASVGAGPRSKPKRRRLLRTNLSIPRHLNNQDTVLHTDRAKGIDSVPLQPPPSGALRMTFRERSASQDTARQRDSVVWKTFRQQSSRKGTSLVPYDDSPDTTESANWPRVFDHGTFTTLRPKNFRTFPYWRRGSRELQLSDRAEREIMPSAIPPEDLSHDLDYFFARADGLSARSPSHEQLVGVANQLLGVAREYGTLDEVRSLCLWKLSSNSFTDLDAEYICDGSATMSDRNNHDELFDFYSELFRTRRFQRLRVHRKLQLSINVLTESLRWDMDAEPQALASDLLDPLFGGPHSQAVSHALVERCRALLDSGDTQQAADLVTSLSNEFEASPEFAELIDVVLGSALTTCLVSTCAKLLRLASTKLTPERLKRHCEPFLVACDAQGAYAWILRMFELLPLKHRDLSPKSYEIIAFACTKWDASSSKVRKRFYNAYRRVPIAMRARIIQSRSLLRIQALWKSSRDLQAVQGAVQTTASGLQAHGTEEDLRALQLVELDIYISAKQLDLVLNRVAQIHCTKSSDCQTVSLAALVLAKKGAWEQLERLLAVAHQSRVLSFDSAVQRRFNNVIRLYANQHSSVHTWKFVTEAVDKHAFAPNQATSVILLESFVSRSNFGLIAKWLRYVQILGRKFHLDATVAVTLLTRFYIEHRPSHVLIMWFCRNLVHMAPSLAGPGFIDLVKEAIGYDSRKAVGADVAWRRSSGQTRLAMLDESRAIIPSPGYRWNGQPYLKHPQDNVLTQTIAVGPPGMEHSTNRVVFAEQSTKLVDVPGEQFGRREMAKSLVIAAPDSSNDQLMAAFNADIPCEPVEHTSKGPSSEIENRPEDETDLTSTRQFGEASSALAAQESGGRIPADAEPKNDRSDLPCMRQFEDLRPSYDILQSAAPTASDERGDFIEVEKEPASLFQGQEPARDMILAFSMKDYKKVLQLYRDTLDAVGLPASPMALEVAIEASIRMHRGDRTPAESMMREAKEAGMNITCAMGPLLIHQMYHLNPADKKDVNNLRVSVIEYYRMNDENGWPVKHHVGVTAANLLVHNHCARDGINILNAIHKSEWAVNRPFDILAMTVFLKACTQLRSMSGIKWVIETTLEQDMRLDRKFLGTLKEAIKLFRRNWMIRRSASGECLRDQVPMLTYWLRQCQERRAKQRLETKLMGKQLVNCIARCANEQQQPAIGISDRHDLEDAVFGKRMVTHGLPSPDTAVVHPRRMRRLERLRLRVAGTIRATSSLDRRRQRGHDLAKYDRQWLKQYRAFLRQRLVMSRGKLASFRYKLADEPRWSLHEKQKSKSTSS